MTALFFVFGMISVCALAVAAVDQCLVCHQQIESPEAVHFEHDVHKQAGLTCASCHGGDPSSDDMEVAMSPNKGYIGVPKAQAIPSLCAKCHSDAVYMKQFNPSLPVDQYEKYLTSVHGQLNAKGDPKPATCVSCHSIHSIYPVKDPRSPVYPTNIPGTCAKCHADSKYMKIYKIPTDQFANYQKSVHGIALLKNSDLSAPACNSCHGNHGAAPPGVNSTENVCGVCHQSNTELFDKSPHKAAFDAMDVAVCVECHGNHLVSKPTDSMIGLDKSSTCRKCHGSSDSAAKVILSTAHILTTLTNGQEQAKRELSKAEQLGMDVAEAKYSLKDANQSLIEARVKIHSFALQPVQESARSGMKIIDEAKETARRAVQEYYYRRQGLGISTLILTVCVVLLYLKIKKIEQK